MTTNQEDAAGTLAGNMFDEKVTIDVWHFGNVAMTERFGAWEAHCDKGCFLVTVKMKNGKAVKSSFNAKKVDADEFQSELSKAKLANI